MTRSPVSTPAAPAAIGPYSQAVQAGKLVFLSGQIGLDPATMQLAEGIDAQAARVFDNLKAVAEAAGGSFAQAVRVTIYLTDFAHFDTVNEVMKRYFAEPYPARVTVGVRELPRAALVEVDLILALD